MKQDHIGNILAAMAMVEAMPNRAFVPDLAYFANYQLRKGGPGACGAVGCFGGWVAVQPFFQAQGVYANESGFPCIGAYGGSREVSSHLFGRSSLFTWRDNDETGTEKEIILARLKAALERQTA